jgi:hypothetical protein
MDKVDSRKYPLVLEGSVRGGGATYLPVGTMYKTTLVLNCSAVTAPWRIWIGVVIHLIFLFI